MKTVIKWIGLSVCGLGLAIGGGCAPTMFYESSPTVQPLENPGFRAELEAVGAESGVFVSFRLRVKNRSDSPQEIDWNGTRYLHAGRDEGVFIFEGIKPEDVRNGTIPPEIIPAGGILSKEIAPFRLLARQPGRELRALDKERTIFPGIIPAGESGVQLVVNQDGRETVEKITLIIREKKTQWRPGCPGCAS